tara:strand:+ start:772 stop:1392 length:621 start_codon:yes stop_codon:yes gene_type:complete
MKLTEAKLKQMIIEMMYSPSTLIKDALADPDVHPKIKDLLASESDDDKRQGIQLLDTMYPDKYGEGVGIEDRLKMGRQAYDQSVEDGMGDRLTQSGTDHVHLGSKDHNEDFAIRNYPPNILEERLLVELREFEKQLKPLRFTPSRGGFSIYALNRDRGVEVSTFSGGRTMMELDAFAQFLEEKGYDVSELDQEDVFGKIQYYFRVK